MKKVIDKERYEIFYYGSIEELKIYLKNFYESFGIIPDEEINKLEKISSGQNKHIGPVHERLYYSNRELKYRVNSSNPKEKEFLFPFMKKRAEKIDGKFLEENPRNNLEVESSE